jgi:hypothetical protein
MDLLVEAWKLTFYIDPREFEGKSFSQKEPKDECNFEPYLLFSWLKERSFLEKQFDSSFIESSDIGTVYSLL